MILDSKKCTKTDRKITHFFLPQCAQNASNCISGLLFAKHFRGGIPPDPPRGSCPPGIRNTHVAYFQNLADYFQIYGEHCMAIADCKKEESVSTT